jgi:hypothetical protein
LKKLDLPEPLGPTAATKSVQTIYLNLNWQLLVLLRDATAETPLTNAVDFGAKRLCYDLVFVACEAFNYSLMPQQAKNVLKQVRFFTLLLLCCINSVCLPA